MRNGISTASLYPMETEKSLELLLGYGYRLFEFFVNSFTETKPAFLKELKSTADYYGAEFRSVHPFTCALEGTLFFGDYDRRFEDGLEMYKRYTDAANFLGCKYIVLHGQAATRNGQYLYSDELYFERFLRLSNAAKAMGVTLCQENVFCFRSHSIEFINKMSSALGNDVRFVFDIKQALNSNQDVWDMIDAMGGKIVHVHLSDNNESSNCLLPGAGNFDIPLLLSKLNDMGYSGDIFTEVYRSSYKNFGEIQESCHFMERLLNFR